VGELALSFPVISNNIAIWNNSNGNLRYTTDLSRDDDPATFNDNIAIGEFSFQSLGGTTYGLFKGNKTSLATECSGAKGVDPDLTNINNFFGLIEKKYPSVFPAGPQTYNQKLDGYTYRYYFDSQVFVAVKSGIVYVNGGEFGNNLAPVAYGTLSNVLAQLNNVSVAATVPASSAGTYSMAFASATPFSPFSDGAAAQVVVDANGSLCLDGVSLGTPFARQSSPNRAYWENVNTGLSVSLDLNALSSTAMTLTVQSSSGLAFSTLVGNRTSLVTGCGSGTATTNITLANQLFGLAETYFANLFPASLLSFNQLEGNLVKRFYPSTGLTIQVDGATVSVKGGSHGPNFVYVGQLASLITQINTENTPAAPIYDLRITGTGTVIMLSTSIAQKVDIRNYGVALPDSTDSAILVAFVRTSFAGTLPKIDTVSVSSILSTATQLVFNATVSNSTTIGSSTTKRSYDLVYTVSKR